MPRDECSAPQWTVELIGRPVMDKVDFFDMSLLDPRPNPRLVLGIGEVLVALEDLRHNPFSQGSTPLASLEDYFEIGRSISQGELLLRYHVDPSTRWISVVKICCDPCLKYLRVPTATETC